MNNNMQRPVRSSDFFIIITGFILNVVSAFEALAEDLHNLSIYNSEQKNQESKIWEKFSQDLESIKENKDG